MNKIILDLKEKFDEKENVIFKLIKNFDRLIALLSDFRKKKRLTIMLRGRKRDGMNATETFEKDFGELDRIRKEVYGEIKALTESVENLTQVVDFLGKKYLDDAALFVSSSLSFERKKVEGLMEKIDKMKELNEVLEVLTCDKEIGGQIHLCIDGLDEFTGLCRENVQILDAFINMIDYFRNEKKS